jgi:peptidoglycan hydrolase-like protein with peptidoglycan-binding domain
LNVWYEGNAQTNDIPITIDCNPFTEPVSNCKVGTLGNDANWVLWYMWRFGKLLDDNGAPDASKINSLYSKETASIVKEVQKLLGLKTDGIVGTKTRALFKKLA